MVIGLQEIKIIQSSDMRESLYIRVKGFQVEPLSLYVHIYAI